MRKTKTSHQNSLEKKVWFEALHWIHPSAFVKTLTSPENAYLFLGKASVDWVNAVFPTDQTNCYIYGISPENKNGASFDQIYCSPWKWVESSHPIPNLKSMEAGQWYLRFLQEMKKRKITKLEVFLSGGASSLFWLPAMNQTLDQLQVTLKKLYKKPYSIQKLNQIRSTLCLLKDGGAYRLFKYYIPSGKVKLHVISDVAPYDYRVVGSGPFNGADFVQVHADQKMFLDAAAKAYYHRGYKTLGNYPGLVEHEKKWIDFVISKTKQALKNDQKGVLLFGGECGVQMPKHQKTGRGGRVSYVLSRLALEFQQEITTKKIKLSGGASDGVDGNSPCSFYEIDHHTSLQGLSQAVASWNTGEYFHKKKSGLDSHPTGTNVQDLICIRVL